MRVRGVYIRGHKSLPDIQLNFNSTESVSSTDWVSLVSGLNGSGKTLVCHAIRDSFSGAVREQGGRSSVMADLIRVDFVVDNQVVVVQSSGGRFERHSSLSSRFDFNHGKNMLLHYDCNRLAMDVGAGFTGLKMLVPILSDIHVRGVSDSIFVIDDFGMGLSAELRGKFYKHLRGHLRSRNNQLILTSHESLFDLPELRLESSLDVMELAMREVSGRV